MKTFIALALIVGLAQQAFAAEPLTYFNPEGTEEDSFRTPDLKQIPLPGFSKEQPLSIEFVANAPEASRAPHQPAVRVKTPGAVRWIQILDINVAAGENPPKSGRGHQLLETRFPWRFVDCFEGNRKLGVPFYYNAELAKQPDYFFDTPAWGVPQPGQADGERRWIASCFAVRVSGRTVTGLAGFRWGYHWQIGEPRPVALPPSALERKEWEQLAPVLAKHYENWTFE